MKLTTIMHTLFTVLSTVSALSNYHAHNYDTESTFAADKPKDEMTRNDPEMKRKSNLRGQKADEAQVSVMYNPYICQHYPQFCATYGIPTYDNYYDDDDDWWYVKSAQVFKEASFPDEPEMKNENLREPTTGEPQVSV